MGKRKKKLSLIGIILLVAAVAGAIVAVTGIFLNWFKGTLSSGFMGLEKSMEYGLFGDLSAETGFSPVAGAGHRDCGGRLCGSLRGGHGAQGVRRGQNRLFGKDPARGADHRARRSGNHLRLYLCGAVRRT